MANQFSEKQFQDFLKKQQEVKANWEAADRAAGKIAESAENIKQSTINQAKIGESISRSIGSIKTILGVLGQDRPETNTNDAEKAKETSTRSKNTSDVMTSMLEINKSILSATKNNSEILLDILQAIQGSQQSEKAKRTIQGSGGGGGRGTPPPPNTSGSGGGNRKGGILSGVSSLLTGGAIAGLAGLAAFELFDAKKIKDNVDTLLSIGSGYENKLDFLKEGGTLFLALSGLGLGLLAFSAGQAAAAIAQFMSTDKWAQTIVDNVSTLLSISDLLGGDEKMLYAGGSFALAMTGIGIGLASFGIGQAAAGLAQFVSKDDWAQRVVDSVSTLLSITDVLGGNLNLLYNGGAFVLAMTGIGAGLVAFSVGQAATALAQFVSKDNWAETIKDNVETLLSIADLKNVGLDTAKFVGVMAGLAAGLTVFALGKGLNTVVEGADKAVNFFSGQKDFAQTIKDNVETLLSIANLPGVGFDTAKFIGVMGGIATGLTAFALGKGANVTADAFDNALQYFTGQKGDFADRIYNQVDKLLSITKIDTGDTGSFIKTMGQLVAGLTLFTASDFLSSIVNAGTTLVNFLTGSTSPFDKILELAKNAGQLATGADALQKIANALATFGDIKAGGLNQVDFKSLAENLAQALPLLNGLAHGGKVSTGWFSGLDFGPEGKGGLLNPDLKLDEMVTAIGKVNAILNSKGTVTATPNTQSSAPAAINSAATQGAGGTSNVIVNNNNVTNNNGGTGPGSIPGPAMGGAISTAPQRSPLDNVLYGRSFSAGHQ